MSAVQHPSPIRSIGPALVVLAVAAAVLLVGPKVVERITFLRARAQVDEAMRRLGDDLTLERLNAAARAVAEAVEPSVVHIATRTTMQNPGGGPPVAMGSSGSGWIWDQDGHIVTNAHVVDGADVIEVQLHSGTLRRAEIIGLELRSDIAVLRIEGGNLVPAQRGSSDSVRQGDMVFAFGSPFEFRFSMSSGIVSGLGRSAGLTDIDYENFIQVDAAINPGNSGGPLTDVNGRVVGMNTAIATNRGGSLGTQGQFAGIGLAIPMSMIEPAVDQLIDRGEVEKGFMGLSVVPITEPLRRAQAFNGYGVLVRDVVPGGPAARAGVRRGDVITHMDGRPVTAESQVPATVASHRPGDTIAVRLWRVRSGRGGGETLEFEVILDKLDPAMIATRAAAALQDFGIRELQTSGRPGSVLGSLAPERGVIVVEVAPGSAAERVMPPGSLIVAVNGMPVASVDEFYARLSRLATPFGLRSLVPVVVTLRIVAPGGQVSEVPVELD